MTSRTLRIAALVRTRTVRLAEARQRASRDRALVLRAKAKTARLLADDEAAERYEAEAATLTGEG